MKLGFWMCLLTMIPGLLIRVPVGGAGILLADFILPVFAASYLLHRLLLLRQWKRCYFFLWGMGFGMLALVSWLLNAWHLDLKEQIISASYLVRWFSVIIFGVAASELFSGEKKDQATSTKNQTNPNNQILNLTAHCSLLTGIYLIIFIILFLGYIQFFFIPDIGQFSTAGGFDPHIGRFLGTWMDPNFVAGLLAFFVPLMLGSWYASRNDQLSMTSEPSKSLNYKKTRRLFIAYCSLLIVLALLALFLTFSRSGYLAAGLGIGLFFLLRDPKIILIGIIVVAIGIASNERAQERTEELAGTVANIVFQETDEIDPTASLRLKSWLTTLELWEKYPVFGIGYNTYRYIASEEGIVDENYFSSGGSDSSLLTILVTTGVVGFITFMIWYLRIWSHHLRRFYKAQFTRHPVSVHAGELHLGVWAGWTALLLHSFFVNSLLFPLILMPIMAVVGVLKD